MSYMNAAEILPVDLIQEIQKYVDGEVLYIPRKNENVMSWGEKSGAKDRMAKRNKKIFEGFHSGTTISELSQVYFLSEKRIQGIIHEYEALSKDHHDMHSEG